MSPNKGWPKTEKQLSHAYSPQSLNCAPDIVRCIVCSPATDMFPARTRTNANVTVTPPEGEAQRRARHVVAAGTSPSWWGYDGDVPRGHESCLPPCSCERLDTRRDLLSFGRSPSSARSKISKRLRPCFWSLQCRRDWAIEGKDPALLSSRCDVEDCPLYRPVSNEWEYGGDWGQGTPWHVSVSNLMIE